MALPTDPAALLSLLSALQSQVATLSAAVATSPAKPATAASGGKKRAKKEAAPAADAPAEKREVPVALRSNVERINAILSDMKKEGWSAFTNAVGKPYPGSKRSEEGAWVREDNGKPADYPFAMIYASYLRCRDDPAEMAKARAYREKVDKQQAEKRSAGSASTGSSAGGGGAAAAAEKPASKRGAAQKERWAKMSPEEAAAEKAKLKERLAAGKAKKAGSAAAEKPAPAPAPAPAAAAEEEDDGFADAEEAAPAASADRTFIRWTFDGERYYKNALNHVLSNDTEWVGVWDGSAIQDAEPPAYLDGGDVQIVEDEDAAE